MWDENACVHGLTGVMVVPSVDPVKWGPGFRTMFLPLYLMAMFHKCRNCGKCCQAFDAKLARGVELTRKEALTLQSFCRITKRNGKYLLKYPCPLQKNQKCTQYEQRPFCCRAFPIVTEASADLAAYLGVFMACPEGKGTYVTTSLFLQELRQLIRNTGRIDQEITFDDLEQLKAKFNPNRVSQEDMEYIRKTAREIEFI